MHNRLVRNSLILLIVLLFVVSMKGKLINGLFAIWVGAWVMSKLFNPFFGPHQGFENLTISDFIPHVPIIIGTIEMIFGNRKLTFFVLLWYSSGILVAFLTYRLLNLLLIPL